MAISDLIPFKGSVIIQLCKHIWFLSIQMSISGHLSLIFFLHTVPQSAHQADGTDKRMGYLQPVQ